FDASGNNRCTNTIACQPISASPSIVRNLAAPTLGVIVATGGADWARTAFASNPYYALGFDAAAAATATEYFSRPLSSITPPASPGAGNGPGVVSVPMALRSYAQLTIAGSDLYADVTELALGSTNQLAQAATVPGAYGTVWVWPNVNNGIGNAA